MTQPRMVFGFSELAVGATQDNIDTNITNTLAHVQGCRSAAISLNETNYSTLANRKCTSTFITTLTYSSFICSMVLVLWG